jgi:hypothetical protein
LRSPIAVWLSVYFTFAIAPSVHAHPNSVSYAEFSIDKDAVFALARLPLDDVDLLLRVDRDLDGLISGTEIEASRPVLAGYFAKHLHVALNGAAAAATLERLAVWPDAAGLRYLEARLAYREGRSVRELTIHSDFLTELYPSHQTLGRIDVNGVEDRFTFTAAATYHRRMAPDRAAVAAMAVGALTVIGLLWFVRRRRPGTAVAILLVMWVPLLTADVIMSAPALNATLKTLERLTRETASADAARRSEALFQLGAEADALAATMNLEVESHGMQERELLDLALARTNELGVGIAYNRTKKKFFYDGAAFAGYVQTAPQGRHAAAAEFKLISYQFYQSSPADIPALRAAAGTTKEFLGRHPGFEENAEVRLYLAVDYRDLFRLYTEVHDARNATMYRRLARAECLRIRRQYPNTDQADAARQLLRGLE